MPTLATRTVIHLRHSAALAERLHLGGSAGMRNIVRDADHDARKAANLVIVNQTWAFQLMLDAGCSKAEVIDCIDSALNAFLTLEGKLATALDEVGLADEGRDFDLSGLEELKAALS